MGIFKPKKKSIQDFVSDIRALEKRLSKVKEKLAAEQFLQAMAVAEDQEINGTKMAALQSEIESINGMIAQVTRKIEDALIAQRHAEDESLPGLEQQFNTKYSAHLEKCGCLIGEAIVALQSNRQPATQSLAADLLEVYKCTTKHSSKEIEPFSKGFVMGMSQPAAPATVDMVALKGRIRKIKSRSQLTGEPLRRWSRRHAERILAGELEVPQC